MSDEDSMTTGSGPYIPPGYHLMDAGLGVTSGALPVRWQCTEFQPDVSTGLR